METVSTHATLSRCTVLVMSTNPKPFLKYCGGKSRLLSKILPRFPKKIGTYYEPFLGGGAVFFELAKQKRFDRAVLGDMCSELMNAFQAVRDDVDNLIAILGQPQYKYDRKAFLDIRRADPDKLDPTTRAARTIYLNRTCFNGLFRVNSKGRFNTPFGKYDNPVICDAANLRACSSVLQTVELAEGDFGDVCTDAGWGDAIYFDPPYLPISKTSNFTQYTPGGFSYADHRRLSELFKELNERDVALVLSNSHHADILGLFDGFRMETVTGSRSIGRPDKRESVPEVIVDNEEEPCATATSSTTP
jgi:DNA adenine methylase